MKNISFIHFHHPPLTFIICILQKYLITPSQRPPLESWFPLTQREDVPDLSQANTVPSRIIITYSCTSSTMVATNILMDWQPLTFTHQPSTIYISISSRVATVGVRRSAYGMNGGTNGEREDDCGGIFWVVLVVQG